MKTREKVRIEKMGKYKKIHRRKMTKRKALADKWENGLQVIKREGGNSAIMEGGSSGDNSR